MTGQPMTQTHVMTPMPAMTPMQRVVAALERREGDRVPFALALTLHGSQILGLSPKAYYADPANVVEGQCRLHQRYGADIVPGSWYASLEMEAWGGEVLWFDDGPPNAGAPIIRSAQQIRALEAPRPADSPRAKAMLEAIAGLRRRLGPDIPILGGIVGPASLPVIQMGFERYLRLLIEDRPAWDRLMAVNEAWTVAWGNAQIAAGATGLGYFDPFASSDILPPELYAQTGALVARRVLRQLNGPTMTVLASGRAARVIDEVAATGTLGIGISSLDDLADVVARCRGKLAIAGNLDGMAMLRWTPAQAEAAVRDLIRTAAPGGGLVVTDHHGEIPFGVTDEVLMAVADAVRRHGRFPIRDTRDQHHAQPAAQGI